MKSKPSFWQRIGMHDWFLKKPTTSQTAKNDITPEAVYKYILEQFKESIRQLSFAGRVVFYHEYIIVFNASDYKEFTDGKKGIFGLIVQESVRQFYEVLKLQRLDGKNVQPSSSKWVFRFVSNPEYAKGDMGFIGKLLPGATKKEENLRVTYIPRQTGIAQTSDINNEILKEFTFYSEGYYEVPYQDDLAFNERAVPQSNGSGFARLEAILPDKAYIGKKVEYIMKDPEIVISGNDDTREASNIFRVPSEWVNTPHLRIRYDRNSDTFSLASFGEKTLMNEKAVAQSNLQDPVWIVVPVNSKLLLNGIVAINLFKS